MNSVFYSVVFHENLIVGPAAVNEKYLYPVIHNRQYPFLILKFMIRFNRTALFFMKAVSFNTIYFF